MKITILLCSLATIATGAPRSFHERESSINNLPISKTREKKSYQQEHAAIWSTEVDADDVFSQRNSKLVPRQFVMEGRNVGSKKPIIIKKKIGYHLYRDSDEEMAHADPHENCRKQVKVKLCDEESGSLKNVEQCFTSEEFKEAVFDNSVENSIKNAKEAVENLQRGFDKIDQNSPTTDKDQKALKDDIEVHQNIEAARKALEHVQQSFGNLDSLNIQEIAMRNENFQQKLPDDENLAKWKEAINNIQKNIEIAKNIEDTFAVEIEKSNEIKESQAKDSDLDVQQLSQEVKNEKLNENDVSKKQREDFNNEMFTSPTEQKELNVNLHSDSLKSEIISTKEKMRTNEKNDEIPNDSKTYNLLSQINISNVTPTPNVSNQVHKVETNIVNKNDNGSLQHNINENLKKVEKISLNLNSTSENSALLEVHETLNLQPTTEKSPHTKDLTTSEITKMIPINRTISIDTKNLDTQLETINSEKDIEQDHIEKLDSNSKDEFLNGEVTSKQETKLNKHRNSLHDKQIHPVTKPILHPDLKMRLVNEKQLDHISNTKAEFDNKPQDTITPTFDDNKVDHKLREIYDASIMRSSQRNPGEERRIEHFMPSKAMDTNNKQQILNDHVHLITEDQRIHEVEPMHWSTKNQLRDDESQMSPSEEQFINEHMTYDEDPNIETKLRENHDFKNYLLMKWAQDLQRNDLSHLAKTTNGNNEHVTEKDEFSHTQHMLQHMQNELHDDNLHGQFLMRLAQEKQQKNLYKTPGEIETEHLQVLPENRFANNFDLANGHDFSQLGSRMNIMRHGMTPDVDSAMQPSMHSSMRDSPGTHKSGLERNDINWNHHHHAMARYGSSLPVNGIGPGTVGVFPNTNTGCGIPLMLSCSPSVVSGTLAKPHPSPITAPAYRAGDDLMFYMKRNANNIEELPTLKIQKSSLPFAHKSELIYDKKQ